MGTDSQQRAAAKKKSTGTMSGAEIRSLRQRDHCPTETEWCCAHAKCRTGEHPGWCRHWAVAWWYGEDEMTYAEVKGAFAPVLAGSKYGLVVAKTNDVMWNECYAYVVYVRADVAESGISDAQIRQVRQAVDTLGWQLDVRGGDRLRLCCHVERGTARQGGLLHDLRRVCQWSNTWVRLAAAPDDEVVDEVVLGRLQGMYAALVAEEKEQKAEMAKLRLSLL